MEEKEYQVIGALSPTAPGRVLGCYDTLQSAIRATGQYRRRHSIVWMQRRGANGKYVRISGYSGY